MDTPLRNWVLKKRNFTLLTIIYIVNLYMMYFKKTIPYCFIPKLLIFIVVLSSCSTKNNQNNKTSNYQENRSVRIKLNYKQSFIIEEVKKGTSLADIHVSGIGFNRNCKTYSFLNTYPYHDFLISDLNNDGFEELLIISLSGNKTKKISLHGVISIDGNNYKPIYCPEFDTNNQHKFEYLDGYKGGDSLFIKEGALIRVFPIGDIDREQTLERYIHYKLMKHDNNYSLQVSKSKDVKKNQ